MTPALQDGGGRGGDTIIPPDAQMRNPPEPGDSSFGLRCTICSIDWPPVPDLFDHSPHSFAHALHAHTLECPVCKAIVVEAGNLEPLEFYDAWVKKMYADFERFYEARGPRDVLTEEDLAQYGVPSVDARSTDSG